jgi:hypothetical protein
MLAEDHGQHAERAREREREEALSREKTKSLPVQQEGLVK